MKAIITLFFVLFIGVMANAQDTKVEVVKEVVTTEKVSKTETEVENKKEVARLYKFKNSKIKKELSFSTKRGKSKLA